MRRYWGLPWAAWAVVAIVVGIFVIVFVVQQVDQPAEENPTVANIPEVPAPPQAPPSINSSPTTDASCQGDNHITWEAARQHVNTKVAVVGPVENVQPGDNGTAEVILGKETPQSKAVTIQLSDELLPKLPGDPADLYNGQTLCVIGVVQAVGTELQIVVNQPDDISIF